MKRERAATFKAVFMCHRSQTGPTAAGRHVDVSDGCGKCVTMTQRPESTYQRAGMCVIVTAPARPHKCTCFPLSSLRPTFPTAALPQHCHSIITCGMQLHSVAQPSLANPHCARPSPATRPIVSLGHRSVAIMAAASTRSSSEAVSQAVKEVGTEAQQPTQPGKEAKMKVKPQFIKEQYKGSGKLSGKVALITGGDSGIGRAVAVHYAREGAKGIVIVHTSAEQEDADETVRLVEAEGGKCLSIAADVGDPKACEGAVASTIKAYGQLDVLVNNAGEQHKRESILEITPDQIQRTFATNIFSMFYLVKAALPHLKSGASIINTASLLAYMAKPVLVDYASSKGAVVSFTRSLSEQLVGKGIRVNAVAPGPIWSPLIPTSMGEEAAETFGEEVPMKRGGQPCEVAPAFVFLASELDSSFFTGQVLHPNGGAVLNV